MTEPAKAEKPGPGKAGAPFPKIQLGPDDSTVNEPEFPPIRQSSAFHYGAADRSFFGNVLLLFDFKFQYYLTPWVVRVTWVVFLVFYSLILGVMLIGSVASAFDSDPVTRDRVEGPRDLFQMRPDFSKAATDSSFSRLERGSRAIVNGTISIVFVLMSLLWCRVFLEMIIVVFNISNTLKSIESRRDGPG